MIRGVLAGRNPIVLCLTAALLLNGLAGCDQVHQMVDKGPPPLTIDPNDSCSAERKAFNEAPYFAQDTIVQSSLIGAAGGAVAGGLIAGATHGNILVGVAVGVAAGLAAGLSAGYYQTLSQQSQDKAVLENQYNADLTANGQNIDRVLASFGQLRTCRYAQAAQIKSLARRKLIDRDTAVSQLAYQRDRFKEEIDRATLYGANMRKQAGQFDYAAEQIKKDNAQASTQAKLASTESIQQKRGNYDHTVAVADANLTTQFDIDTKTSWLLRLLIGHA